MKSGLDLINLVDAAIVRFSSVFIHSSKIYLVEI
jgi:hypothetical protein